MSWDERPKWQAMSSNYISVVFATGIGFMLFFTMLVIAYYDNSLSGVPFGLFGCCFFFVAWQEARDMIELARNGKLTVGKVVDRWQDLGSDGQQFFIAYEYGHGYRAFQDVPQKDFIQLYPGCQVFVRYLPEKPRVSRMERH